MVEDEGVVVVKSGRRMEKVVADGGNGGGKVEEGVCGEWRQCCHGVAVKVREVMMSCSGNGGGLGRDGGEKWWWWRRVER